MENQKRKTQMNNSESSSGALWGCGALIVLSILFFLIFTVSSAAHFVDDNEICAVVNMGKVTGESGHGLQWEIPYIVNYDCYPSRISIYQTSEGANGNADYNDFPVDIRTSDGQEANVMYNVSFFIEDGNAEFIRSQVANNNKDLVKRVIAAYARSVPRDLAAGFTAEQLYGTGRSNYEEDIQDELLIIYADYGVTLDRFVLREIIFNEEYQDAIEAQQIARENIQTQAYHADAAVNTAKKAEAEAEGEANAEIQRARGDAESTRVISDADAYAILTRGEALQQFPEILALEFYEALETINWMILPSGQFDYLFPIDPAAIEQPVEIPPAGQ